MSEELIDAASAREKTNGIALALAQTLICTLKQSTKLAVDLAISTGRYSANIDCHAPESVFNAIWGEYLAWLEKKNYRVWPPYVSSSDKRTIPISWDRLSFEPEENGR